MPKPPKSKRIKALRAKLWRLMSVYIRSTSGHNGSTIQGKCFTCDKYISLKYESDTGHMYEKKAFGYLYYDVRNLRIQCSSCNRAKAGNVIEYERRLRKQIGAENMDEMHDTRNIKPNFTEEWLIDEVAKYDALVDGLPFVLKENRE